MGFDFRPFDILNRGLKIKIGGDIYVPRKESSNGRLEIFNKSYSIAKLEKYSKIEDFFYEKNLLEIKNIIAKAMGKDVALFEFANLMGELGLLDYNIELKLPRLLKGNFLFIDGNICALRSKEEHISGNIKVKIKGKWRYPRYIGKLEDILEGKLKEEMEDITKNIDSTIIPESIEYDNKENRFFNGVKNYERKSAAKIKKVGYKRIKEDYFYVYMIIGDVNLKWREDESLYELGYHDDFAIVVPLKFENGKFEVRSEYGLLPAYVCESRQPVKNEAVVMSLEDLKEGKPSNSEHIKREGVTEYFGRKSILHPYIGDSYDNFEKTICVADFKKLEGKDIVTKIRGLLFYTYGALTDQSGKTPRYTIGYIKSVLGKQRRNIVKITLKEV
ncbi:MAG: hypothetical protein J7K22_00795 [Nanoarchaeota archaeon]|nr:hypothetical protein [Nanoarchaeota archaeon]